MSARRLGTIPPGGEVEDIQDAANGSIRFIVNNGHETRCVTPPIKQCQFVRTAYEASQALPCPDAP